jgi:hypothetical protein
VQITFTRRYTFDNSAVFLHMAARLREVFVHDSTAASTESRADSAGNRADVTFTA